MAARTAGRKGRPWRRLRAGVLAASDVCWICGHPGSRSVDHVIPLSLGGPPDDPANLRPAHGIESCPTCGERCNTARGNRMRSPKVERVASRDW